VSGGSPLFPDVLPPPVFKTGVDAPLSGLGSGRDVRAAAGPSDFTRIIGRAAAAPPPVPSPAEPPKPGVATSGQGGRRLPTGLIIAMNAIVLIAIVLVLLLMRRSALPPAPASPSVPSPTAPPPAPAAAPGGSAPTGSASAGNTPAQTPPPDN